MKRKYLLLMAITLVIGLSLFGIIHAKTPPPSGYVYPLDYQTEYNQGVGIHLVWVTNQPSPIAIWLTDSAGENVTGYSWIKSTSSGDFVVHTAALTPNETYDIWLSFQSGDHWILLNAYNYWEFTIVTPCQSSQTESTTPDDSGVVRSNQALTGVNVTAYLNRPTVLPQNPVVITTAYYGSAQPAGSAVLSVGGVFYDVNVYSDLVDGGTQIDVAITNDVITSSSTLQYWDTATNTWVTVPSDFVAPHTLIGHFIYTQLQGTQIFVTPEYTLGALLALVACFVGFAVYKTRSRLLHLRAASKTG